MRVFGVSLRISGRYKIVDDIHDHIIDLSLSTCAIVVTFKVLNVATVMK